MTVLESIGFTGIRYDAGKHTMRFAREAGTNPTSVVLNCSNLFYKCFSTRARGTLFTLVMDKRRCSFPDALRYVCKVSGLDKRSFEKPYQYPFGGFYKIWISEDVESKKCCNYWVFAGLEAAVK